MGTLLPDCRIFILCRDRAEARAYRRRIAEAGIGFNLQVGTWLELLQAAADAYLIPPAEPQWQPVLTETLPRLTDVFWSGSYAVAPEQTRAIISRELDILIRSSAPESLFSQRSISSLSQRAQQHLDDLTLLQQAMDYCLPDDLAIVQRVLQADKNRSLRRIKVYAVEPRESLDPWIRALIHRLNNDSADGNEPVNGADFLQRPVPPVSATSLGLLHHHLYTTTTVTGQLDDSLQWLAVRDPLEEVEIAAGMIQTALRTGRDSGTNTIGLLLPNNAYYSSAVNEVFRAAGLPLSGLVQQQTERDLGKEVVFYLLQSAKKPAPTMAMAAFATSALLPWSRSFGFEVANTLMAGDYTLKDVEPPTPLGRSLLTLIRDGIATSADLRAVLTALPAQLNADPEYELHRQRATGLCADLLDLLRESEQIPWEEMLRQAAPESLTREVAAEPTREGIAVFYEHQEPWREVTELFVLGFNDGHYPQSPPASAVFSAADREVLKQQGFNLDTVVAGDERLRSLFVRQLQATTSRVHFLSSRLDLAGNALYPSSSLAFMAQLFPQVQEPEDLILDLDTEAGRSRAFGLAIADTECSTAPRGLEISDPALQIDLLAILKNRDGSIRAQSPSSLETLMTSPLAWLLDRARLIPPDWEPESLDVMAKGTLAHAVFERLFAPGIPVSSLVDIEQLVPQLLKQTIINIKPFLNRPEWQVERFHLEKEITTAAMRFREILDTLGATILGVEVWLKGTFDTQAIHGSADLLLQLPDGKIYVVDYKKSSSKKRKERMHKGYDSQASLYRIMLQSGSGTFRSSDGTKVTVAQDRPIGAMYYLMNDQVALADTDGWTAGRIRNIEELGADVSVNALPLLKERLAQVKRGQVLLNSASDEKWFDKNAGIPLYALDRSPLIRLFMHPARQED
ncbi:PD-(D/E)XK nuclease family protein [Pelovirga terrestris]|uniref:PD-(D/E)XK nuclease family protein n=1 Tax=Pelovirga terrestris TaxID=2771352 RepID=A0A8J6UNS6_9BACT|nr:PD-(D/E)XK nuclease family protein [Pelovirga terrestris]MBD1400004.1 PD-(D/E)XK nuclease family protein [Pelovirga terrestris]